VTSARDRERLTIDAQMAERSSLDAGFHAAVAEIDAGDLAMLDRLIDARPALVTERLDTPGAWLRDRIGSAAEGFFRRPYLLWFVAASGTPLGWACHYLEDGADTPPGKDYAGIAAYLRAYDRATHS
jgi:hypothetical protein